MKSLRQKVEIYSGRAKALANALGLNNQGQEQTTAGMSPRLNESDTQAAMKELALTLEILRELLATCHSLHIKVDVDSSVLSLTGKILQDLFGEVLVKAAQSMLYQFVSSVEAINSGPSMLEALMQWREIQVLLSTNPLCLTATSVEGLLDPATIRLRNFERNLDEVTQISFKRNLRYFLSNEWLYPWVHLVDEDSIGRKYDLIFNLAGINQGVGMNTVDAVIENINSVLRDADIGGQLLEEIASALQRVAQTIDLNEYEGIFDIFDDGGTIFSSDQNGWRNSINIIPGNKTGKCQPVLFAFANGRATSTPKTMRLVREHLIQCQGTIKVAILFAPLAHIGKGLEESAGDLKAQIRNGPLAAFIPIAIFRNKMSIISW